MVWAHQDAAAHHYAGRGREKPSLAQNSMWPIKHNCSMFSALLICCDATRPIPGSLQQIRVILQIPAVFLSKKKKIQQWVYNIATEAVRHFEEQQSAKRWPIDLNRKVPSTVSLSWNSSSNEQRSEDYYESVLCKMLQKWGMTETTNKFFPWSTEEIFEPQLYPSELLK